MKFYSRHRADGLALFALALVCALVFCPLLNGQTLYYGDLQLYFQPMATFWKSNVAQGRVPLWNAGILGGTPFVGSPQMWILYPSALLFIPFSAVAALTITTVFHFWLAGAFFYAWTRRGCLQLQPLSAFLGACVWMLSGFLVAKSQFPNMLQAIAWVPAVLWAGEVVAARANFRSALVLALVLSLQLLAAHAQISLFSGYMLSIYAFFRWRAMQPRRGGWRVVGCIAGALALTILLTLGQTLPVVEALHATVRQSLSLFDASRFSLIPWAIGTLVVPHFYGNPMKGVWHYPFDINIWESVCYIGIAPLLLALVAASREARARFWVGWTLGFLWISMGVFGGLYALAFFVLPGVARFHDAGRFLVGFSLGGAVLAALGAQYLLQNARNGARWTMLLLALTLLDLGVFARGFYPTIPIKLAQLAPAPPWGHDDFIETRQGRIWTMQTDGMWPMYQPIWDMRPGDFDNTRRFFANVPPNRHLLNGWIAEVGYEPLYDRATQSRVRALELNFKNDKFPPQLAAQLGRNSVRILQIIRDKPLLATPDWTLVGAPKQPIDGKRIFYYRNEKCLPRARFQTGDEKWQRAQIANETSSSLELEVPSDARQIELADSMRPGWSASLDEQTLQIETTIEGWRRVNLPFATDANARRVRFEYAPVPWKLGVFISLCALGFLCAGLVATRNYGK